MMFPNHSLDLWRPGRFSHAGEMLVGLSYRWRQIIKRSIRPDTEVMACRCDGDLLHLVGYLGAECHTEVQDSVRVVSVRGEIAADFRSMNL